MKKWIVKNWLWGLSLIVMLASSALDGRYIRSWMFDGLLGVICGYGLNFAVDIGSEILSYEFIRHRQDRRDGKERDTRRLLSWLLLFGQFGLIYFGIVFSWRQLSLLMPNEPSWLLWSAAAFSQFALVFLGIAQALRDGKMDTAKSAQASRQNAQELRKPKTKTRMGSRAWRELVQNPNGSAQLVKRLGTEPRKKHAEIVNLIMDREGFERLPDSTARDRARVARKLMEVTQ